MKHYKTLAKPAQSAIEIKKSRFLGRLERVASHEEGLSKVAQLWELHPDARHICFTMLVGGQVRQSDDGEPSGTAARPMLNVLQHQGADHILATVVRYFGGVKLGAGGLVRAYTQAVSECLTEAQWIEVQPQSSVRIRVGFEFESLLRHQADTHGVQITLTYDNKVYAELSGDADAVGALLKALQDLLRGTLEIG